MGTNEDHIARLESEIRYLKGLLDENGFPYDYEAFVEAARLENPEAGNNDIIEQLDQQAFDQAIVRLLEKMPPESRLLFSLRFEEELTVPQIAVIMAVPEGTVKSRLHILTQTIKQKLRLS